MVAAQVVPGQSDPQVRARLDDLRLDLVRLASLTLDAIRAGREALVAGDLDHADRVVADDDAIDALRHAVEDACLRIIVLPGLCPTDLRFVARRQPPASPRRRAPVGRAPCGERGAGTGAFPAPHSPFDSSPAAHSRP